MPTLTRQELFDLVWKDPVRTVAATLKVSDVWLKKCCAAVDIPVPDRGYWAKVRAGKSVVTRRLRPRGPGMPDTIMFGSEPYRSHWPVDPERELAEPLPIQPHFAEPIEEFQARIEQAIGKAKLESLSSPHALVRRVLEEDEKRRTKPPGIPYRLRYTDPLFDSPFERRRLRLLNSLFLAFTKAGFKCWLSDEDARMTGVTVGSQKVSFFLDHPTAKRDRDNRFRPRPGKVDTLRFELNSSDRVWIDRGDEKLEDKLTEIVVAAILTGEEQLRTNAQSAYVRSLERRKEMEELLRKRREETERLAREQLIRAERARQASLLRMSRDLRRANEIRALVDEVVRAKGSCLDQATAVREWAAWARSIADRTDPLNRIAFESGEAFLRDACSE